MKRITLLTLLLGACSEEADSMGKFAWVTDLDAGLKQAAAEKKPVLLMFSGPG